MAKWMHRISRAWKLTILFEEIILDHYCRQNANSILIFTSFPTNFVTILQSVPEKRHNSYLIPQADTKRNRKAGGDAVFNII